VATGGTTAATSVGTNARGERYRDRDDHRYGDYYGHEGHHYYRGYRGDDWDEDYGVVTAAAVTRTPCSASRAPVTAPSSAAAAPRRGPWHRHGVWRHCRRHHRQRRRRCHCNGDRGCLGPSFELARIGRRWCGSIRAAMWPGASCTARCIAECREFELRRAMAAATAVNGSSPAGAAAEMGLPLASAFRSAGQTKSRRTLRPTSFAARCKLEIVLSLSRVEQPVHLRPARLQQIPPDARARAYMLHRFCELPSHNRFDACACVSS